MTVDTNSTRRINGENRKIRQTKKRKKLSTSEWLVLIGLLLLTAIPVIGGIVRLTGLIIGVEITPENVRFFDSPLPVAIHIIALLPYSILGAFQFVPRMRHWKPDWHRAIGRVLVPSGLAVALSGLWMTHFYTLPEMDGEILYVTRLLVGSAMTLFIVLGYFAARQRDFKQHAAWMIRAYALAMGAGTQVFTHIPWFVLYGTEAPAEFPRAIMMGAGWLINIIVAEWIIRRYLSRPRRATSSR